jgi:hypothetical protein
MPFPVKITKPAPPPTEEEFTLHIECKVTAEMDSYYLMCLFKKAIMEQDMNALAELTAAVTDITS